MCNNSIYLQSGRLWFLKDVWSLWAGKTKIEMTEEREIKEQFRREKKSWLFLGHRQNLK